MSVEPDQTSQPAVPVREVASAGLFGDLPSLPDVLRIHSDGTLFAADGRDVREYLAAWVAHAKITEQTPITLMTRAGHEQDHEYAFMMRNWGC
jgi:hypothetical protein